MYIYSISNCTCNICRFIRLQKLILKILSKLYIYIFKKLKPLIILLKRYIHCKEILNDIKYQSKYNIKNENCMICLDSFDLNCKLIRSKCNHHFHKKCFENYYNHYYNYYNNNNNNNNIKFLCPLCRIQIS